MEYNEELAQKIIDEHKLSANTLKTWKTRNSIPDKYLKAGFEVGEEIPEPLQIAVARMKEIISHDFFVKKNFVQESNRAHFLDASLGRISFNLNDLKEFKGKVDKTTNIINKIILNKSKAGTAYENLIKEIFTSDIILLKKVVSPPTFSDLEYNQLRGWIDNRRTYPSNLTKKLEDTLMKIKVLLQFNFKIE